MDIRAQLLKGDWRANAEAVARFVGDYKDRFATLMHCMLDDTRLVGQRAAYGVSLVCEAHPHLIKPYVKRLLDVLDEPVHEAVQRNSIRILQHCELPKVLHGRITEAMFGRIADPQRSIAQRAFAITVAMRMVTLYPELADELRLLLDDALRVDPGPAIRSRAVKTLKVLGRQPGQKGGISYATVNTHVSHITKAPSEGNGGCCEFGRAGGTGVKHQEEDGRMWIGSIDLDRSGATA